MTEAYIDRFTPGGAELLAATIRAYWSTRGRAPNVWVEGATLDRNTRHKGDTSIRVVRSDMVNGMPKAGATT